MEFFELVRRNEFIKMRGWGFDSLLTRRQIRADEKHHGTADEQHHALATAPNAKESQRPKNRNAPDEQGEEANVNHNCPNQIH
jgi:hypothetical protein